MSAVLADAKLSWILGIATLVIDRSIPITKFVRHVATRIFHAVEETLVSSGERSSGVTTLIIATTKG